MNLIKLLREGNYYEAKQIVFQLLDEEKETLKESYKKWLNSTCLNEARFKITKVKIRRGKVLRRHKSSTMPQYTFRGGKMTRMSSKERRNRRVSQRKGKIKRRAKMKRALIKRKRSLRRLKNLGGARKK